MLRLYLSFTEENYRIRQIPTNHKNALTKNKVKKKMLFNVSAPIHRKENYSVYIV